MPFWLVPVVAIRTSLVDTTAVDKPRPALASIVAALADTNVSFVESKVRSI
jgi:hypothetical protein